MISQEARREELDYLPLLIKLRGKQAHCGCSEPDRFARRRGGMTTRNFYEDYERGLAMSAPRLAGISV